MARSILLLLQTFIGLVALAGTAVAAEAGDTLHDDAAAHSLRGNGEGKGGVHHRTLSSNTTTGAGASSSFVDKAVAFSCSTPEAQLQAAPHVVHIVDGTTTKIYFGYTQATSINKNPIVAMFRNSQQVWCRTDYETSGADGVSNGGYWTYTKTTMMDGPGTTTTSITSSSPTLYAAFMVDGTQDSAAQDFRRVTTSGWLNSYGTGGGPKVSVVVQINATDGAPLKGTFVRSELDTGKVNSLIITNMTLSDPCSNSLDVTAQDVVVHALAYFMPLKTDKTRFALADCAPDTASPFSYTLTLSSDLTTAKAAVCRAEPTTPTCNGSNGNAPSAAAAPAAAPAPAPAAAPAPSTGTLNAPSAPTTTGSAPVSAPVASAPRPSPTSGGEGDSTRPRPLKRLWKFLRFWK